MNNPACFRCKYVGSADGHLVFLCMGGIKQLVYRQLDNLGYSDCSIRLEFWHTRDWDKYRDTLQLMVSSGLLDKRSADKVSSGIAIDEKEVRLDRFA